MQKNINKILDELEDLKEKNTNSFTIYIKENDEKIQNAINELKKVIL